MLEVGTPVLNCWRGNDPAVFGENVDTGWQPPDEKLPGGGAEPTI